MLCCCDQTIVLLASCLGHFRVDDRHRHSEHRSRRTNFRRSLLSLRSAHVALVETVRKGHCGLDVCDGMHKCALSSLVAVIHLRSAFAVWFWAIVVAVMKLIEEKWCAFCISNDFLTACHV